MYIPLRKLPKHSLVYALEVEDASLVTVTRAP